jgi:hypothetical protein
MGAPLLRVNGRDLSPYLNLQHDAGFDPVNEERIVPQFAGSVALREGEGYVGEAVGNREWTIPLILSGTSRAVVHQLVQDIQNDLVNGAQVEFAVDSATDSSTFFILERGELGVEFEYFLSVHATTRADLKLWTRPHGSTGTQRTLASFQSTGPQSFLATGVIGDRFALADLELRVGSSVASAGRVLGYAVHRSPSFNPILTASQIMSASTAGQNTIGTVIGASGAIASQYLGIGISPTGATGIAFRAFLAPVAAHVGRHRVLGVMRSRLDSPIAMYARDRFGAILGPTAIASQTDAAKWQLVDIGEISVPARASGQEDVPTQYLDLIAGGASNALPVATYALQTGALFLLNLDHSPGLLRTTGAGGRAAAMSDAFGRLDAGVWLSDSLNSDGGHTWNVVRGKLGGIYTFDMAQAQYGYAMFPGVASNQINKPLANAANATAIGVLGSGVQNQDVYAEANIGMLPYTIYGLVQPPSGGASGLLWELWPKALTNGSAITDGVGVRYSLAAGVPQLALMIASAGATSVLATAAASALTPGIWSATLSNYKLAIQVAGPTAQAWVGTTISGAAPLVNNSPLAQRPGWVAARINNAGVASVFPFMDNLNVQSLGAGASDIGSRQWFRFESYPEERAIQSSASAFVQNQTANFRGVPPRIPVTGSPGASGPVRVLAFEGEVDNFQGADVIDVRLDALERFQFLR